MRSWRSIPPANTDALLACQTDQARAALSNYVLTYGYEFNEPNPAEGPIYGPPIPGLTYGDYHTSELSYVFGLTSPNGTPVTGKDIPLSQTIISYWTNFAKTGTPSGIPHGSDPIWLPYKAGDLLSLKDQSATLPVSQFNSEHNCGFWNQIGLGT
jgi:para-nitrobenzyl esterase